MRRITSIGLLALAFIGTAIVWAAPTEQANLFQQFILEARTDLELLANEVYGEGVRPETWTFNTDLESEKVVVDLWYDNEQLADEIFGVGNRPPIIDENSDTTETTEADIWFGATSRNPDLIARNMRHDLELSADAVYGPRERPEAWIGAAPIYRCGRTLQNTVRLLDQLYNTRPATPPSALNYCLAVESEIETELIQIVFQQTGTPDEALPDLVLSLRGDLERLANEVYGVNDRPANWVGNVAQEDQSVAGDAASDIEILADTVIAPNERPEEWTAFTPNSLALAYRNLRFNLELLADRYMGEGMRPNGWQGEDPLSRCDIIGQSLVFILQRNFDFIVDPTLAETGDFCAATIASANQLADNPPEIDLAAEEDKKYSAESNYAFAYMDVAALEYMGIMPAGTEFRAWYRNYSESNMMFVSGADFALYIDRRFTTMEDTVFRTLPTLDGVIPLTFCNAGWCNGPGPTPTPTGSGPLLALIQGESGTAQPGQQPGGGSTGQQTQVSWNHIRVTYLLDRTDVGLAQVALELCAEPQQIACEPVTSVFDNTLGTFKPVLSQFNGLNVYEFRYGYNSNVRVESQNYISNDIWISDPTIR